MRSSIVVALLAAASFVAAAEASVLIKGDRGDQIFLDGAYVGTAPLILGEGQEGIHELRVTRASGEVRHSLIWVTGEAAALDVVDAAKLPVEATVFPPIVWPPVPIAPVVPGFPGYFDGYRGPLGHPIPGWITPRQPPLRPRLPGPRPTRRRPSTRPR